MSEHSCLDGGIARCAEPYSRAEQVGCTGPVSEEGTYLPVFIIKQKYTYAWMVELVDTGDSKSPGFGCEGSSPSPGTSNEYKKDFSQYRRVFLMNFMISRVISCKYRLSV